MDSTFLLFHTLGFVYLEILYANECNTRNVSYNQSWHNIFFLYHRLPLDNVIFFTNGCYFLFSVIWICDQSCERTLIALAHIQAVLKCVRRVLLFETAIRCSARSLRTYNTDNFVRTTIISHTQQRVYLFL